MVEIIEHSDYNAPIDNKNIALIKFNHYGKSYEKKAFKMSEGIWVIPEVFNQHTKNSSVTDPNNFSCYNKNYLSTEDERSDYLKKTTTIFKRVALNSFGGELLKYLKYSNPILSGGDQVTYIRKIENVNGLTTEKVEEIDCTVIIHGDSDLTNDSCYSLKSKGASRYEFGSRSFINFCPEVVSAYNHLISDSIFLMDPATVLFHELTHAFHHAHYSSGGLNVNLDKVGTNVEEVITFGGIDLDMSKENIKDINAELLRNRKKIIDSLNSTKQEYVVSNENKEYIAIKYNLKIDKLGNLFTNKELDEKYIYTIFYHFTEVNFSDAFNLPKRLYYSSNSLYISLAVDVNNAKEYTVENGLEKSLLERDKSSTVTLHKNSYLPKNWQQLLLRSESTLYQWQYLLDNYPDLHAEIIEKDDMLIKYRHDELGIKVNIPSECSPPGFRINT